LDDIEEYWPVQFRKEKLETLQAEQNQSNRLIYLHNSLSCMVWS
jgi:hypothetical protein